MGMTILGWEGGAVLLLFQRLQLDHRLCNRRGEFFAWIRVPQNHRSDGPRIRRVRISARQRRYDGANG